jgi:hypothetical protein
VLLGLPCSKNLIIFFFENWLDGEIPLLGESLDFGVVFFESVAIFKF